MKGEMAVNNLTDIMIIAIPAIMLAIVVLLFISKKDRVTRNSRRMQEFNRAVVNSNNYIDFTEVITKMKEFAADNSIDINGDFRGYIK